MSFSIVHLSDPHFGGLADLAQVHAVESLLPDLEPQLIVVSGDLTQRARHGEFQAARAFVKELERTAPVYVQPGNHDVQWWWRPFIPFGTDAKYAKYRWYFGSQLAPTLDLPDAIIAGALTSHGVAWGSLTARPRDIAVKGHLPAGEMKRVTAIFKRAKPEQVRVLVVHHNVLRGELSNRMGLARWRGAQRRIVASGADVVLCGHDHQEQAGQINSQTVVSCAGTLSTRSRGGRPASFSRVVIEPDSIVVELWRFEPTRLVFRRSDTYTFARHRIHDAQSVAPAAD